MAWSIFWNHLWFVASARFGDSVPDLLQCLDALSLLIAFCFGELLSCRDQVGQWIAGCLRRLKQFDPLSTINYQPSTLNLVS